VGDGPATASIVIEGFRENRSIVVEGLTQGIADGEIVRPWIKFPGETTNSEGVASRAVTIFDADDQLGDFEWTRQTSKKTYVYFRTEDGTQQSLRFIIPGR